LFRENELDIVLHFAALKSVGELTKQRCNRRTLPPGCRPDRHNLGTGRGYSVLGVADHASGRSVPTKMMLRLPDPRQGPARLAGQVRPRTDV
jgi:UDP-glucose 4-epimerase